MEMEASDMLDVLHFLFEEDFTSSSEEHARSRSAIRSTLYSDMYGVTYRFKMNEPRGHNSSGSANDFDYSEFEASLDDAEPVNPKKDDAFSSRNIRNSKKKKIDFIDASSVPLVEQSFEGLDAPLN